MIDVFLSYSHKDREIAERIVKAVEEQGWSVWWDQRLLAGRPFEKDIREALGKQARCVVVLWSGNAVRSKWVESEARRAEERNILVPALIEKFTEEFKKKDIPMGLDTIHYTDLTDWLGNPSSPSFGNLLRAIEDKIRPTFDADLDLPINPHHFSYEKDIIELYRWKNRLTAKPKDQGDSDEEAKWREEITQKLTGGCPPEWPQIINISDRYDTHVASNPNTLSGIGSFRDRKEAQVAAAALTKYKSENGAFCFPEAGPREQLVFPTADRQELNVGIVVSGGIAPGINAVIDGIVQRHFSYKSQNERRFYDLNIFGYLNGLHGLQQNPPKSVELVATRNPLPGGKVTSEHANEGGSMIGTYRWQQLLDMNPKERCKNVEYIVDNLGGIDILYVIGGDGSMRLAHAIWHLARSRRRPLAVVGIPKTTDNDILWMWQSFGFLSAVEKAREIVEQLHTETKSNPRMCVLQLFGSDSGFVVSHAVLASAAGQCDLALIPEVEFSLLGIAKHLKARFWSEERQIPHGLVVMAETAIPVDAEWYIDKDKPLPPKLSEQDRTAVERARKNFLADSGSDSDTWPPSLSAEEKKAILAYEKDRCNGKRIAGQTNDHLRRGGLKIVMRALQMLLPEVSIDANYTRGKVEPNWRALRVFANEPRHLLRAVPPSTSDVVMGQRLGILAVDNAMAGFTDFMISQWLTEFVLVPLRLVVLGRKRIPEEGIFLKQVLAKTGQNADLVFPWSNAHLSDEGETS